MRALSLAKNAIGCAAVVAMLVLSGPGVEVVRAGEPHAQEAVCRDPQRVVGAPTRALEHAIEAEIQRPRPRPQRAGDEAIVVLNVRGYNYDAGRSPIRPPN